MSQVMQKLRKRPNNLVGLRYKNLMNSHIRVTHPYRGYPDPVIGDVPIIMNSNDHEMRHKTFKKDDQQ